MSQQFAVITDRATLHMAQGGSITGVLAVRLGDLWFPERVWSDFPVVVLNWWLTQCSHIASGDQGRFFFMDGPFMFDVYPIDDRDVRIDFLRDGDRLTTVTAPLVDIPEGITAAAKEVLRACETNRWDNADIQALRLSLEQQAA